MSGKIRMHTLLSVPEDNFLADLQVRYGLNRTEALRRALKVANIIENIERAGGKLLVEASEDLTYELKII